MSAALIVAASAIQPTAPTTSYIELRHSSRTFERGPDSDPPPAAHHSDCPAIRTVTSSVGVDPGPTGRPGPRGGRPVGHPVAQSPAERPHGERGAAHPEQPSRIRATWSVSRCRGVPVPRSTHRPHDTLRRRIVAPCARSGEVERRRDGEASQDGAHAGISGTGEYVAHGHGRVKAATGDVRDPRLRGVIDGHRDRRGTRDGDRRAPRPAHFGSQAASPPRFPRDCAGSAPLTGGRL